MSSSSLTKIALGVVVLVLLALIYTLPKRSAPKQYVSQKQEKEKSVVTCGDIKDVELKKGEKIRNDLPPFLKEAPSESVFCGVDEKVQLVYYTSKMKDEDVYNFYTKKAKEANCQIKNISAAPPDLAWKEALVILCTNGNGYVLTDRSRSIFAVEFHAK